MSVAEFHRWQGYLRRNPVGWHWLAHEFAELKREVAKCRLVGKLKKVPDLKHYRYRAPEPLFYARKKREAKSDE